MQQVEISKSGIKTSILSYISDYAISLFLIAFIIFSYFYPIFERPLKDSISFNLSTELKIFILLLVLLLTHPIGVLINGISWFCLGWMEKYFETFHFKHKCFLNLSTKNYLCFDKIKEHYTLNESNFYATCRETEAYLWANKSELLSSLDESLGKSILLRNLTFCTLLLNVYYFVQWKIWIVLILFALILIFILFNSLISFYYSLGILLLKFKLEQKEVK